NVLNNKNSGWDVTKMKVSKNFKPSTKWQNKNISVGKNLNFDYKKDFIILPEIWSHFAVDLDSKGSKAECITTLYGRP
ncbi:MAG: hypothetical protein HN874_06900, partial [Euryarchaeota archaeon]|nr:hypothetical protein [Euryarchaeota archaeon]